MAIYHAVPLTKRVRFSLPCNHVDRDSSTYGQHLPLLNNRTKLHPMFLTKLQQHASRDPTPSTTTLREGVRSHVAKWLNDALSSGHPGFKTSAWRT
jgi:hypothetical protein